LAIISFPSRLADDQADPGFTECESNEDRVVCQIEYRSSVEQEGIPELGRLEITDYQVSASLI